MKKRLLSALLALGMMFSLVPVSVFADDTGGGNNSLTGTGPGSDLAINSSGRPYNTSDQTENSSDRGCSGQNWSYTFNRRNDRGELKLHSGTYDFSAFPDIELKYITLQSTSDNPAEISGGVFKNITGDAAVNSVELSSNAVISGGTFYKDIEIHYYTNAQITGGLFWKSIKTADYDDDNDDLNISITGGIFAPPDGANKYGIPCAEGIKLIKVTAPKKYITEINGCPVYPSYNADAYHRVYLFPNTKCEIKLNDGSIFNYDNVTDTVLIKNTSYAITLPEGIDISNVRVNGAAPAEGTYDSTTRKLTVLVGSKISIPSNLSGAVDWTAKIGDNEPASVDEWVSGTNAHAPTLTFTAPAAPVDASGNVLDVVLDVAVNPDGGSEDVPSDGSSDSGALAAVVVGGTAAAGYLAGTRIWLESTYGFVPKTRIELAKALWNKADCPSPAGTELYADIDENDADAQAAARWCVEQGLLKDYPSQNGDGTDTINFKPNGYAFRPQAINAWYKLEKLQSEQPA